MNGPVLTRPRVLFLTAVAAAGFVLLCGLFGEGLLWGTVWNGEAWLESPLITWLLVVVIAAAGIMQANRLPVDAIRFALPRDRVTPGQINDPRLWQLWMGNVLVSFLWLPIRFFIGREWLGSGLDKLQNPAWMESGEALKGFWTGAVTVNESGGGRITYDWYREFLRFMLDNNWYPWFAKLVTFGELLIGIALLLGAVTGLAAFLGSVLNFNFGLAGAASSNPVLFGLSVLLVLAWRTAGHWGLDRFILGWFGIRPNPVQTVAEPNEPGPAVAAANPPVARG